MNTKHLPHCENCGSTDREDLVGGDQGYTACCNELVCDGRSTHTWGYEVEGTSISGKVRACCGHKAQDLVPANAKAAEAAGKGWISTWKVI